jgi:hypothetical protein
MHSLLFQAARYWAESLYTAIYILNLLPTKAISAPTPTFGSSGVPATRTPLPLLPIS